MIYEISAEIILLEAEREIDRLRDEVTRARKQLHEAMLLLESSEPGRDIYADIDSRGRWKLRRDKLLRALQLMSSP
jgi:hypothetical protein